MGHWHWFLGSMHWSEWRMDRVLWIWKWNSRIRHRVRRTILMWRFKFHFWRSRSGSGLPWTWPNIYNSRCFLDGKFCHGDWFEPNQVNGGYMVRLMSENDMIGSWWQVNASDFDTSTYSTYSRDIGYHGVESRIRIGAAQNCARNADLFFDAGALSAGAIAGIVIGCVFGK